MTKHALLLIDIQNDYFDDGKWPLVGIESATDNAARILRHARDRGDSVIHIRHEFESSDAPFFTPGSDGAQIHKSVQAQSDEAVVLKHKVNAFLNTELKALLDSAGVTSVTLVGAMSHMCVHAAARAASDFGYQVTVVEDACATRELEFNGTLVEAKQVHAAFMSALSFAYADLVTTQDYLTR